LLACHCAILLDTYQQFYGLLHCSEQASLIAQPERVNNVGMMRKCSRILLLDGRMVQSRYIGQWHDKGKNRTPGMTEAGNAPIGVFDSGVGGLTILKELLRELPNERYIYFRDTGNCPYGVRPVAEIQELSRNAVRFLLDRGAKIIVV